LKCTEMIGIEKDAKDDRKKKENVTAKGRKLNSAPGESQVRARNQKKALGGGISEKGGGEKIWGNCPPGKKRRKIGRGRKIKAEREKISLRGNDRCGRGPEGTREKNLQKTAKPEIREKIPPTGGQKI